MKKRKTLKGITSILGIGILGTTLAMSLSNCGNKPPIETIRTIDGSDWNGRQSGTMLYSVSTEDKVVTYTGSSDDYAAVNLVFPGKVKDPTDDTIYKVKIGDGVFAQTNKISGTLTISSGIETIEEYAFYGCSGLVGTLTISNSVASIGNYAFYNCSGLTGTLTIPNSVTSIGTRTFEYCSRLTSVVIPNSVTTIGLESFCNCSGLTGTLTIPNSVASIGGYAFMRCNFTSIDMRSFPSNGFLDFDWSYECTNVQTFYAPSSMEWNDNDDGWDEVGTNNAQFIASLPSTGNANTWFSNNVQKSGYGQNWTFSWAS